MKPFPGATWLLGLRCNVLFFALLVWMALMTDILSGGIQADAKKGLVLLDNSLAGPSFWRFDDQAVIKTYSIAHTRNHYRPKNIHLADAGTTVVAGGDHGDLYVFDTHSGARLEKLSIGMEEFVQVVIVRRIVFVGYCALTTTIDR